MNDEPLSTILATAHNPLNAHPIINTAQLAAWSAIAKEMETELAELRTKLGVLPVVLNIAIEAMDEKRLDIARSHHETFAYVRDETVKVFGEGVTAGLGHWENEIFTLKHTLEQKLEISLKF